MKNHASSELRRTSSRPRIHFIRVGIVIKVKGRVGASYSVVTLPHSVLIDSRGRIAGTFEGGVTKSGVEKAVDAIAQATPR
jgi:hypothetical protein